MINRTTFVCLLPEKVQKEIENKLSDHFYSEFGLIGKQLEQAVQDGMDSRLCDLTEVLDIEKLGLDLD